MGKNEDKMTLSAIARLRKEREEKDKKKAGETTYSYDKLKDKIKKLEMKKGGAVKGYKDGGSCRGGGAATQGTKFKGTY